MASEGGVYPGESRGRLGPLAVLAVLAVLALAGAVLALQVLNGNHAVEKHGEDAAVIQRCLDNREPDEVWAFTGRRRENHFIQCVQTDEEDENSWGIRIIRRLADGRYQERTSFVVKDGTRQQMIEYVSARAKQFFAPLP